MKWKRKGELDRRAAVFRLKMLLRCG